jgi:hypothetical protein
LTELSVDNVGIGFMLALARKGVAWLWALAQRLSRKLSAYWRDVIVDIYETGERKRLVFDDKRKHTYCHLNVR